MALGNSSSFSKRSVAYGGILRNKAVAKGGCLGNRSGKICKRPISTTCCITWSLPERPPSVTVLLGNRNLIGLTLAFRDQIYIINKCLLLLKLRANQRLGVNVLHVQHYLLFLWYLREETSSDLNFKNLTT